MHKLSMSLPTFFGLFLLYFPFPSPLLSCFPWGTGSVTAAFEVRDLRFISHANQETIGCVVPSQPSGERGHPLVPQLAATNSPALSEPEADLCPTETFSSPAGLQATDLVFSGMRAECNIDCNAYCSYLLHSLARKR